MRPYQQSIFLAFALGAASISGCAGAGADTATAGAGAAGTPSAGGSSTPGTGGVTGVVAAGGGGGVSSVSSGGQTLGGAGSGGVMDSGGGAAQGGDVANGGRAGSGLGGTIGTAGIGGGAGGTGAYKPCPTDGAACKILPFGDSITRGVKSSSDGGYRAPLYELILAAKQKATFTGSQAHGPAQVSGQPFPRKHEGHAGWTIDPGYNMVSSSYGGISTLVPSPALDENPNIILLMIGTNDLFARDTAGMATRLEALLDKLVEKAPKALIVLAGLTPLGHDDANLTKYNAKLPAIVQARAAKGQHVIGVDMSKLPVSELADGTHPNDKGYGFMANVWYAAIKDLLPAADP